MLLFAGMFLIFNSATIRRQSPASDGTVFATNQALLSLSMWCDYRNENMGGVTSVSTAKNVQDTTGAISVGTNVYAKKVDDVITIFTTLNCNIRPDSCEEMFMNHANLIDIDLEFFDTSNVTSMYSMFECCESLANVNISNFNTSNIVTMTNMFDECLSLQMLDLTSFSLESIENSEGMFACDSQLSKIYVPYNQLDAFKALDNGSKASAMIGCVGDYGIELYEYAEETYVKITGYIGSDSDVTIPSTITISGVPYNVGRIGTEAFKGISLTSVTIPGSVDQIDYAAFKGCGLTSVTLNEGLTYISSDAFKGNNFTTVSFPFTVWWIGNGAFGNCSLLTSVYFKGGIDDIRSKDNGLEINDGPGFFASYGNDYELRAGANASTVGVYVPEEYLDGYIAVAEGYDGYNWGLYTDLLKGYDPNGGNTGVIADIVIPSVIAITLCAMLAYVSLSGKKKRI